MYTIFISVYFIFIHTFGSFRGKMIPAELESSIVSAEGKVLMRNVPVTAV